MCDLRDNRRSLEVYSTHVSGRFPRLGCLYLLCISKRDVRAGTDRLGRSGRETLPYEDRYRNKDACATTTDVIPIRGISESAATASRQTSRCVCRMPRPGRFYF